MKEKEKQLSKKTVGVLIVISITNAVLLLYYMELFKIYTYQQPPIKPNQQKYNTSLESTGRISTSEVDFCKFQLLNDKETQEEQQILKSIAWPQTPLLLGRKRTDVFGSRFSITRRDQGQQWHVGDELKVTITMKDFLGKPKKAGGDVLAARIYSMTHRAGVPGHVIDHENGSYTALFPLIWSGTTFVQVTLLHTSEAVAVVRRMDKYYPDRIYFKSIFSLNGKSEKMACNFCLRPTNLQVCDFTDISTGEPWFCYKPKKLGCETRVKHSMGGYRKITLMTAEKNLFQNGFNMKVRLKSEGPQLVNVLPQEKEQNKKVQNWRHSGFYYGSKWEALDGTTVQHFSNSASMSKCLQGKKIYMYGDSTVRQWYEYLVTTLPDLKNFDLHTAPKTGPYMATDDANNIFMMYHTHSVPIRIRSLSVSKIRYVANELNAIEGGPDTVIIVGLWAHFGSFPDELFLRRMLIIRKAIVKLLNRSPGTLVVIRNGNIKDLSNSKAIYNSDWTTMQHNRILKALFQGVNVRWVDAWEMTLAYGSKFILHPLPPVIKNMVDLILSYICPLK